MKYLLPFLLTIIISTLYGQDLLPVVNNEYRYEAIVETPSVSKSDLISRSKSWFSMTFPESVVHVDTVENRITGKGKFRRPEGGQIVDYKIVLDFKEGKYRYMINEFVNNYVFEGANKQSVWHPVDHKPWRNFQREMDQHIKEKLSSLHSAIIATAKTDW